MRAACLLIVLLIPALLVDAAYPYPFLDPSLPDDARIFDVLTRVTLQQKIDTMQVCMHWL
jgi:hypothetical protein